MEIYLHRPSVNLFNKEYLCLWKELKYDNILKNSTEVT